MSLLAIMAVGLLAFGASCFHEDEDTVEKRAVAFAQNYFNLRFRQASTLCTDASAKWISYRASNISQADLDVLDAQTDTATCEVEDISDDDDTATVTVTVRNFLRCDSIGKAGNMCREARFSLPMRRIGEKWFVDINKPL